MSPDETRVLGPEERRFVAGRRVGRLATIDSRGRPRVVPVCYVLIGDRIYSPLDEKPKTVAPGQLGRVRDLQVHPDAALVVDEYSDDWSQLAYVLLRGLVRFVGPEETEHAPAVRALRAKYPQYRDMVIDRFPLICLSFTRSHAWSMRPDFFRD